MCIIDSYNIKVNSICPGPIESELMRRVGSDEQLFNTVISRTPIGRIGTPNECGRLAVFLACEDSDFPGVKKAENTLLRLASPFTLYRYSQSPDSPKRMSVESPRYVALGAQHVVHGEAGAHLAQHFNVVQRLQPLGVIQHLSLIHS